MGEASGTEGPRKPVRVMLADNHAMFLQAVAGALCKDGEVEVVGDAGSGPEAIEIARQTRPDAIIMEVEREPEEAAMEIGGMLEASPESRVAVLTIHRDPGMVRRMLQIGTSAYVHKSATVEELVGALRRATRGSSDGEGGFAVLGVAERMVEQVKKADDYGVSARELEVLVLAGRELCNAQIASRLHLSEATVKRHLANLYPKLGVCSRGKALSKAMGEGWITKRDIVGTEGREGAEPLRWPPRGDRPRPSPQASLPPRRRTSSSGARPERPWPRWP